MHPVSSRMPASQHDTHHDTRTQQQTRSSLILARIYHEVRRRARWTRRAFMAAARAPARRETCTFSGDICYSSRR